jgi:DpnII restriction endonuclease
VQIVEQKLEDITGALTTLEAPWQDEHAVKVMAFLQEVPVKDAYTRADMAALFEGKGRFRAGFTVAQLFLGISKDEFQDRLGAIVGPGNIGAKYFAKERETYLDALEKLELPAAMAAAANFKPAWSDILIERLRSGRGKAIKGQTRGRELEDFTETVVREVFGDQYETRCQFTGVGIKVEKCDFAIPDRHKPLIIIESKAYGATGSKQTDVVGDVNKIIDVKRPDTPFILITDGITWMRRLSDLRKLIKLQNDGHISRIYTTKMAAQFEADLRQLKAELGL